MGANRATMDAFTGVRIEFPDGAVATCKALPLSRGLFWAEMQAAARAGHARSQLFVLKHFVDEVAPPDEREAFESLQPAEVYLLLDRFLAHQRPEMAAALGATIPTPTTLKMGTASTSVSTT